MAFGGFKSGDGLLCVAANGTQLIELGRVAGADGVALANFYGRLVSDGASDQGPHLRELIRTFTKNLQQRRLGIGEQLTNTRHLIERALRSESTRLNSSH